MHWWRKYKPPILTATVRSFRFVHTTIVQIKRESFNTLKQWQKLHLPVILYNVPARTGASIENSTTIRLAQTFENIIAIKDASADLVAGKELIEVLGEGFWLFQVMIPQHLILCF